MEQLGRDRVGTKGPGHAATMLWVRTRQGMGAHSTRHYVRDQDCHDSRLAHDKDSLSRQRVLCQDKEFSVATNLDIDKKLKKNTLGIWGIIELTPINPLNPA